MSTVMKYLTERDAVHKAMEAVRLLTMKDLPHVPHWRFGHFRVPDAGWVIGAEGHLSLTSGRGALARWAGALNDVTTLETPAAGNPRRIVEVRIWGRFGTVPMSLYITLDEDPPCIDLHGPLAQCEARWDEDAADWAPCGCEACDVE